MIALKFLSIIPQLPSTGQLDLINFRKNSIHFNGIPPWEAFFVVQTQIMILQLFDKSHHAKP